MFNQEQFLTTNLINGYKNKSFTLESVNIYSFTYLSKGLITQKGFDFIQSAIEEYNSQVEEDTILDENTDDLIVE